MNEKIRLTVAITAYFNSNPNKFRNMILSLFSKQTNKIWSITKDNMLNPKKENEIFETIVDGWTEETNPLLDSFKIKVKDVDNIKNTVDKIKKIKKVDIVNYGEDIVDQLLVVFKVIEKMNQYCLRKKYNFLTIDGVKAKFEDGFALVRASNTGPNITMRFEATTESRLNELQNEFTTELNKCIEETKQEV